MIKKNAIMFCVFLTSLFPQLVNAEMKNLKDENIKVGLQFVNGEGLHQLVPSFIESTRSQKYVVGKVTNLYDRKVTLKLAVKSPENPSIFIESLDVSWIPPKSSAYFVHHLGSPSLDIPESDVRLEYEIVQKMIK